MPYNYPVLMQLLEEFKADPRVRNGGPSQWRQRLDRYLESVPPYYLSKQGKEEYEKTCTTVSVLLQQTVPGQTSYVVSCTFFQEIIFALVKCSFPPTKEIFCVSISSGGSITKAPPSATVSISRSGGNIHNVGGDDECNIPHQLLLSTCTVFYVLYSRMRMNISIILRGSTIPVLEGGPPGLSLKLHNAEELHSLPVSQMGNYEEYIKGLEAIGKGPLREVEPAPVRAHAFGNPFKTDKKSMAIDENHLFLNFFFTERRHSISERSSVVSDLSYTTDLDEEIASTSDTPPTGQNGFLKTDINGDEIIISHNRMVSSYTFFYT
uniref:MADF domain-containing protein n=1 Tax=Heterorhabditis bacteriophora TaxID=37862 RepID=A0A1I7W8J0_HETBA